MAFPICIAMLLGAMTAMPAFSQSGESETDSGSISDIVSPEKAKSRFFLRNEFRERRDDTHVNITEALYDLPLSDRLVLRTQLPYVVNNPPDDASSNGPGDITNLLYYRYYRKDGNSHFAGLETRWNSASERRLGLGKTLLAPTWFASINVPEYDTILFPLVQTYFTVGGDDTRADVSYTALKGRFLVKLENRYYVFTEPVVYVDHEDSNDSTGVLELELGRFVNKQTMLYGRPGVGLWGNTGSLFLYDWNFEVGFRYFFKTR